MRATDAILGY